MRETRIWCCSLVLYGHICVVSKPYHRCTKISPFPNESVFSNLIRISACGIVIAMPTNIHLTCHSNSQMNYYIFICAYFVINSMWTKCIAKFPAILALSFNSFLSCLIIISCDNSVYSATLNLSLFKRQINQWHCRSYVQTTKDRQYACMYCVIVTHFLNNGSISHSDFIIKTVVWTIWCPLVLDCTPEILIYILQKVTK